MRQLSESIYFHNSHYESPPALSALFNTFQCIRCRNCTIDFVSYKCLFRSLIVRLWTGVVLDMLCLQKNRGRNWGIFDPNDFLKLFLKRMDFSPKVYTKNVPNMEVCNFILASLRPRSIKQVIVVLY